MKTLGHLLQPSASTLCSFNHGEQMTAIAKNFPASSIPPPSDRRTRPRWSESELAIMRTLYPLGGAHVIEKLTRRPATAVYKKAQEMGLQRPGWSERESRAEALRPWTPEERDTVITRYLHEGADTLARNLDRTPEAVRLKAHKLRVTQGRPAGRPQLPIGTVRDRATGRKSNPRTEVRVAMTGYRAKDWKCMRVVQWERANGPIPAGFMLEHKRGSSAGDIPKLIKREEVPRFAAYLTATPQERELFVLKSKFGQAIARIEKQSGATRTSRQHRVWSTEETQFLQLHCATQTAGQIAAALGRTAKGVLHQLQKQGWSQSPNRRWTADELTTFERLYPVSTPATLAKRFNRSPVAVRRLAERMKLKKRQQP